MLFEEYMIKLAEDDVLLEEYSAAVIQGLLDTLEEIELEKQAGVFTRIRGIFSRAPRTNAVPEYADEVEGAIKELYENPVGLPPGFKRPKKPPKVEVVPPEQVSARPPRKSKSRKKSDSVTGM